MGPAPCCCPNEVWWRALVVLTGPSTAEEPQPGQRRMGLSAVEQRWHRLSPSGERGRALRCMYTLAIGGLAVLSRTAGSWGMSPHTVLLNNPLCFSKEDLEVSSSSVIWECVVSQHQRSSHSPFVLWEYLGGSQHGHYADTAQGDGCRPPEPCSESVFPR